MNARDFYNKRIKEDSTIDSVQLMKEYAKHIIETNFFYELPIYLTYDDSDSEVLAAFTNKERCEKESEESGAPMQTTTLYLGERK